MKPEAMSERLLSITRSKAKMYEYDVPEQYHIKIPRDPANLFPLAIGLLGDLAARVNSPNITADEENKLKESLNFSAQFFDNFLNSRLQGDLAPYLLLLGSTSYYLRDLPGSSDVLARQLNQIRPNLSCRLLDDLLLWLLQKNWSARIADLNGPYAADIDGVSRWMASYFENGSGQDQLLQHASNLRSTAYEIGDPRQLLFADMCSAVVRKRFENSTWFCLPRYSELSLAQWEDALRKDTFVRELWPSQHRLGQQGIFTGKSAVVQMPTSAGKTKAIEIIIRSAFIAGRTSLAIIVAPFRALCHEIRNDLVKAFRNESVNVSEVTDVFQIDFDLASLLGRQQVLVVTPEKLVYILRHTTDLARHVGLLIYDEGHQFDNGTRGITYELLLTTLKRMIPREAQTVLVSAVIQNATAVGNWLNGEGSEVIFGADLIPTYRTIAFASWLDQLGRLEFVNQTNPDSEEFFVPRIIEQQALQLRTGERKARVFPERNDGQTIALYLGLKVVSKGSVAVFCGTKRTASGLCEKIVDAYGRGLSLGKPIECSDQDEISRLHFLHEHNLGSEAATTQSAALGIFAHHNNIPHGIRLAVEYAVKKGLAKFVICTSTLAQGVNLPIRYLIVTSVYQGEDQIKVRDFHNLIGRAGRSGMYTEGSILFADPEVYDKRRSLGLRWKQVKDLLQQNNSEPCSSTLASLFDPLYSDSRRHSIRMEALDFVHAYVNGEVEGLIQSIVSQYSASGFTRAGLESQVAWKMNIISAIESYLMTHWDNPSDEPPVSDVAALAMETLAYYLAENEQRVQLIEVFKLLAQNIASKIPEAPKRRALGKMLYGVQASIAIEAWVNQHVDAIVTCNSDDDLLTALWSLALENVHNGTFRKCNPLESLQELASRWIQGESFSDLFLFLKSKGTKIGIGKRPSRLKIDHIVEICENALSFEGMLLIGAVSEIIGIINPENTDSLVKKLHNLQKRLKYGLPSQAAIALYEIGFADRVVSMELSSIIGIDSSRREEVIQALRTNEQRVRVALEKYPQYFTQIAAEILG